MLLMKLRSDLYCNKFNNNKNYKNYKKQNDTLSSPIPIPYKKML